MKALTLWEPWASLMAVGAKTIETRSWRTFHRGELLICAARNLGAMAHLLRCAKMQRALAPLLGAGETVVTRKHLWFGHARAIVRIEDCVPVEEVLDTLSAEELAFGNYSDGNWAWLTSFVRAIPPPCEVRGRQGLFDVDCVDFDPRGGG